MKYTHTFVKSSSNTFIKGYSAENNKYYTTLTKNHHYYSIFSGEK